MRIFCSRLLIHSWQIFFEFVFKRWDFFFSGGSRYINEKVWQVCSRNRMLFFSSESVHLWKSLSTLFSNCEKIWRVCLEKRTFFFFSAFPSVKKFGNFVLKRRFFFLLSPSFHLWKSLVTLFSKRGDTFFFWALRFVKKFSNFVLKKRRLFFFLTRKKLLMSSMDGMSHKKTRVKSSVKDIFLFFSFFFWKILISKCFFSLFVRNFWGNPRCDLVLSSFRRKTDSDVFVCVFFLFFFLIFSFFFSYFFIFFCLFSPFFVFLIFSFFFLFFFCF